jgi:hypothetical protein
MQSPDELHSRQTLGWVGLPWFDMSRIMATSSEACAIIEDDTIMFMDDSTL